MRHPSRPHPEEPAKGGHLEGCSPITTSTRPDRALVRLHQVAEFGVVIDVEARGVGQDQRRRGAGIHSVLAFADALERDALGAEADGDVGEVLHDVVDELAVRRKVENLLVEIQ